MKSIRLNFLKNGKGEEKKKKEIDGVGTLVNKFAVFENRCCFVMMFFRFLK